MEVPDEEDQMLMSSTRVEKIMSARGKGIWIAKGIENVGLLIVVNETEVKKESVREKGELIVKRIEKSGIATVADVQEGI